MRIQDRNIDGIKSSGDLVTNSLILNNANMTTPYQIMIVGSSGKGKTYSFRNMNPNTCGFINMEGKPLPFINKFKYYYSPNSWQDAYTKLIEFAKIPEITEVVFDSFSAYMDSVLKTARETKKG